MLKGGENESTALWETFPCSFMHVCQVTSVMSSHVRLCATLWTVAHQAPLFMRFSRQEYWSGLPHTPLGNLPDPGIKPASLCLLHWQADSLPLRPPGKPSLTHTRRVLVPTLSITSTYSFVASCPAIQAS